MKKKRKKLDLTMFTSITTDKLHEVPLIELYPSLSTISDMYGFDFIMTPLVIIAREGDFDIAVKVLKRSVMCN